LRCGKGFCFESRDGIGRIVFAADSRDERFNCGVHLSHLNTRHFNVEIAVQCGQGLKLLCQELLVPGRILGQTFNTTTSMGRLTLNVLLSFAQFEREVTGGRIRDKIAASKKKGMWMGGVVAGEIGTVVELAQKAGVGSTYAKRILRYAILSPEITESILSGDHRPDLTVRDFPRIIPLDWRKQNGMLRQV
jgi:resolvase-like protein